MIRALVLDGKSNEEIVEAVKEVHPDAAIKPSHVSWEIGNQHRNETDWWERNRERVGEVRPGTNGTPQAAEGD